MEQSSVTPRQSKYCQEIMRVMQRLGHATNAELHTSLKQKYPELSATTVHRATARLSERGNLHIAPPANDGSVRYDANIKPHDHFMCAKCGLVQDIDIKESVMPMLENSIKECCLTGRLVIGGICKDCSTKADK
jgi:Fur family transcriptional regulator, peroxide stress response regulator